MEGGGSHGKPLTKHPIENRRRRPRALRELVRKHERCDQIG